MREIKFRIYSKDYGMQYPERYLLSSFDFGVTTVNYIDDSTSFYPITDKDNVLMQYTGLKDKNGKDIYEGDIVKQGSQIYEVCYGVQDVDAFEGIGFNLWSFYGDKADGTRLQSTIEIIGNIYENPELL